MPWVVLVIAGLFEIAWSVGLKYSQGLTRLIPSILTFVFMALSFFLLAKAMKTLPLGTAYAVWTGIGTVGAAIPADDEELENDISPFLAGNVAVGKDMSEEETKTAADMYEAQAESRENSDCIDTCDDDESLLCTENGYADDCKSRVMRGASTVRGNIVELDDSRYYKLAPGIEKDEDIDERIHQSQLVEWLEEALDKESGILTDEERFIIIHHYGLFNTKPMIYSEIAEIRKQKGKGCACSRISQINSSAIRKIRKFFEENSVESCHA